MTVIDLPRNMLINFPQLLNDVNVIVVVSELTLAGARDTIRLLSWLKTNASHAQVVVVANKVQAGVAEISKADFESSIERKIAYTVPYDIKAAANAAKLGQTFCEANRADEKMAPFTKALKKGLNDLQAATMWLVQNAMAKPDNAGAASTDYMHLFGLVGLGYMWGMMAKVSVGKDDGLHRDKLMCARYWMERVVPECPMLLERIQAGSATIMALE